MRTGAADNRGAFRNDGGGGRAGERRFTRQHLVQHCAQRVDVRASVNLAVLSRLLWAHVLGRSEVRTRRGQTRRRRGAECQRNAEVRDERRSVVQEDVLWLDVPMNHSFSDAPMRARSRRRHAIPNCFVERKIPFVLKPPAKRPALDVRHDIEHESIRLARVMERENVRVLQPRGGLDLRQKPLNSQRSGDVRMEDFDSDVSLVAEIPGEIYRRHSATPELPVDPILPCQDLRNAGDAVVEERTETLGERTVKQRVATVVEFE
jgi:hypothetical protein